MASHVFVHNLVAEYIVRLVLATRNPAEFNMPDLARVIQIGNSSRATLGLTAAARAVALIHGRDYVLPTDVQAIAKDVMAHRLVLSFDAIADNISALQVVGTGFSRWCPLPLRCGIESSAPRAVPSTATSRATSEPCPLDERT